MFDDIKIKLIAKKHTKLQLQINKNFSFELLLGQILDFHQKLCREIFRLILLNWMGLEWGAFWGFESFEFY
jgi:hypothetical protein